MLRPDLYIISRANAEENEEKFRVAGANHTINPYAIAGARMAAQLLHPVIVEFLDVAMRRDGLDLCIEEFKLAEGSGLAARGVGGAGKAGGGEGRDLTQKGAGDDTASRP